MRYLTLAADYMEISLQDERDGHISIEDLGLTQDLVRALREWNERYQSIIPKGMSERSSSEVASTIEELDQAGLRFAEKISSAITEESKVRYYSEGKFQYLS